MANKMAKKKTDRKMETLEQWVQVTIEDGKTVTKLYPSNEEMLKRLNAMDTPPDMVYRRLNFVHGVPVEYFWATPDPVRRKNGGHGIQRMAVHTWLKAIEDEKAEGHVAACEQQLP